MKAKLRKMLLVLGALVVAGGIAVAMYFITKHHKKQEICRKVVCPKNQECDPSTGSCVCKSGYTGSSCQYSNAVTCKGHGTAQSNGSCVCDAPDYAGSNCQYSRAGTCGNKGVPDDNGLCKCDSGVKCCGRCGGNNYKGCCLNKLDQCLGQAGGLKPPFRCQ